MILQFQFTEIFLNRSRLELA
uniref:Uncharacterized protein n=1 Tax=Rhizophora mucronata TaxID=61149 RepID=A0A2P2QWN1_RHIMU